MWCGLLSKFFNHSLSSCDRRKRLVSSLTPIHHVIPGCLNCSIPSSIIIVQCLIWWVSSSHSTNVSFHTQLWLSTQLWGLLSSSTVTKLATNASLRQSLYSKVAKGNSDKKPILNKLWWHQINPLTVTALHLFIIQCIHGIQRILMVLGVFREWRNTDLIWAELQSLCQGAPGTLSPLQEVAACTDNRHQRIRFPKHHNKVF